MVNHPISHSRENHTIPPIYENNKLFYASGYDEGETLFKNRDFGRGCIILADDKFYLYSDKGEVALCLPAKTEIELISQFQIPAGKATFAFAYPVIYDGKLYIRYNSDLWTYKIR